ncbi:MAG: hypothetical protein HY851_11375 [candidate division Zixibacteria bacterium]|nr:hypothetical protein [candidate division Zixibacteria bacterium]
MKKMLFFLLLGALMALCVGGALARSQWDQNVTPDRTVRVHQYNVPESADDKMVVERDELAGTTASGVARRSLGGTSATAGSPGPVVDNSYHDWQWTYSGYKVQWRGQPYVQFTYIDRQAGDLGVSKWGYNVYNPTGGGSWPRGAATGCEIQPNVAEQKYIGIYPSVGVNSKGRVVLGGYDDIYWNQASLDDNVYYQPTTIFSCAFGNGIRILPAQYGTGMISFDSTGTNKSRMYPVLIDVQEWNGDTVTHVLGSQIQSATGTFPYATPGCSNCGRQTPLLYFRKMTFGNSGTWVGPTVLDTAQFMGSIASSRVSPKVAVTYVKNTAAGIAHNEGNDLAIYYRESDSIGATWKPKVWVDPYDRTAAQSYSVYFENKGMYDSNDKLHIIWHAQWVPKDPYGAGAALWQGWNYYVNGMRILHWSNATGNITTIYNGEWWADKFESPYISSGGLVCGFLGTNRLLMGDLAISECNGHLYSVWVMGSDPTGNPPRLTDCASGGTRDARYSANGEVYLSVSSDLSGLLWDAHRNLTNTPTPGCDSAGYGGVCLSDVRPTMSTQGMDVTSFGGALTWPDAGVDPGPGTYTGNWYTHLFYVEDNYPDQKAINPTVATAGKWTNNPLKWMRLACVAPVSAPQIAYSPGTFGYPRWTKHGKPDTTVITVSNDGNATLNVATIGVKKTAPTGPNWLATTAASLNVSAGASNTATFGIIVNAAGAINSPGTIVACTGEVYLKSNVAAPRDSVTITITNFLVADTLVEQKWDTVSTGCTRVIVSNNGDVGRNGLGQVNMDYRALGGECITIATGSTGSASVYLYDGGPVVIRKSGTNYIYSNALHQGLFTTEQAFKPFSSGSGAGAIAGTGYDGYYTGTFVNKDTTVGVRRTYYAPNVGTDTCNFVIQKSVFFGVGGAQTNVTLGEALDWDIPTYSSTSGNYGRVLASKNIVYQQGRDTVNTRCQKYDNRFGSTIFLGMYTPAQKTGDTCFNDVAYYGAYVMNNDTLFKYSGDSAQNNTRGAYFWNQMGALSGLTAAPVQEKDQHIVFTYKHNVASLDTLTVYTALVSVKSGDTSTLKASVDKAFAWYAKHLRPGCNPTSPYGCCLPNSSDGRTGNIDCDPGKGVDISDLSTLIDNLFINFTALCCDASANIDGDPAGGVDISDLSALIDNLFINFTVTAMCK